MILHRHVLNDRHHERDIAQQIQQNRVDIQRLWIRTPASPEAFKGKIITAPAGLPTAPPP